MDAQWTLATTAWVIAIIPASLALAALDEARPSEDQGQDRRGRVAIKDIRELIAEINPILRGWGNYFHTGNAADKFTDIDRYVAWRLKRLLIKRKGRNLRAGEAAAWTPDWFKAHGLYRLGGTIRYPGTASAMPGR